jgi:broad specificity phosphatase PhoE
MIVQQALRPPVVGGLVMATASLIAVTPATVPLPDVHALDIQLTADATDITLDLVRHGQSQDNVDGILGTEPPGAPLTDVGKEQAITVGNALFNNGDNDIAGVYASELLRTQQTAWPLDQLLLGNSDYNDIPDGPPPLLDPDQILSGLNELNAGILEGQPLNTFTEIAYIFAPVMWILGDYLVPQLGSTVDPNGVAFDDRVTDAIDTIYNNTVTDGDGKLTDAVFSHAGTISVWTLMNVKNPDFSVILNELIENHQPLSNTGQVVLNGNPTDGWTLISYDGHDVPQTPDLFTGLFVDYRDLITAPQIALYHILEAFEGGDQADITSALETGFDQVVAAITQFPQAVIDTITDSTATAGQTAGDSILDGAVGSI